MVVQQPKTFVVMVDNTLMAWSNVRMHATKHRVMVKGEKDSYMGTLMDPLLFLSFNCRDYILYLMANFYLDSALDSFEVWRLSSENLISDVRILRLRRPLKGHLECIQRRISLEISTQCYNILQTQNVVGVQGFKQRATGNMDDPFLIPGLAWKLVRRPFLRRQLGYRGLAVFPVEWRKTCWCCEVGYFVVVDDLELDETRKWVSLSLRLMVIFSDSVRTLNWDSRLPENLLKICDNP
ncbi:hypothetical protein C5167_049666 [Papaver somniferum]|uniref:Isopenicillin N synthase-like Fe(2+) 2OG dioxygenase domain-containing protein n=1 Tax=Papaver somniferum TaxID=3469 RepID=A0A4Y7KPU6_PAPSO|nr:hypothetical protein C5167_049666 [Papaver somniferum]